MLLKVLRIDWLKFKTIRRVFPGKGVAHLCVSRGVWRRRGAATGKSASKYLGELPSLIRDASIIIIFTIIIMIIMYGGSQAQYTARLPVLCSSG